MVCMIGVKGQGVRGGVSVVLRWGAICRFASICLLVFLLNTAVYLRDLWMRGRLVLRSWLDGRLDGVIEGVQGVYRLRGLGEIQ